MNNTYVALVSLLTLFGTACEPSRAERVPMNLKLHLRAESPWGAPLSGAALTVGHHIGLTDESGQATLPHPLPHKTILLNAVCPDGYSGTKLERSLPPSLLASATDWSFTIVCEPQELDLSIAVLSEGCGELNVALDGVPIGVTKNELFHFVQRVDKHRDFEALEVSVSPTNSECTLESSSRTFAVSTDSPGIWTHFVGKRLARGSQKPRRSGNAASSRPYRL